MVVFHCYVSSPEGTSKTSTPRDSSRRNKARYSELANVDVPRLLQAETGKRGRVSNGLGFYDIDYPRSTLIPSYAKSKKSTCIFLFYDHMPKSKKAHVFSYFMMFPFRWENLSLEAISKPFVYRKMWSQLGTPNRLLADVSQDHEFR